MVAVLVGLKLTLLRRSLAGSTARAAGIVIGACFAAVLVLAVLLALIGLRTADRETARAVTVLIFSSLGVAWTVLPLLAFGVDETLDPRRFALLPLTAQRLRPGMMIAGLIGVPGVATCLAAFGLLATWSRSVLAVGAALIAIVLGVATSFLASRVITSAFAHVLSGRRFKDLAAVLLGVLSVSLGLGMNLIGRAGSDDPDRAGDFAVSAGHVAGWTPYGWAWAVPADVADGAWGTAAVHLGLAVSLVLALWWGWGRLLDRALTTVTDTAATQVRSGHRLESLYGTAPAGAVAARCLRYWRRDPRYVAAMVSFVILPVVMGLSMSSGGSDRDALLTMPLVLAALCGPGLIADLAYDGSALWTHVSSGVSGSADRWGRVMALMTWVVPLTLVALAIALVLSGRYDRLIVVLAVTISLACCGSGLGLAVGAVYPGTAPPPGGNPFSTGSGNGFATIVVYVVGTAGAVVLSVPVIVLAVIGMSHGLFQIAALALALVLGPLVLWAGVRWGGHRIDTSWPELLTKVSVDG
ncbi:hypothetical protein [Luteipulveratus mongoliensis]|uniref:Transporter n=1 Tax=Luteipulveratus mongoliensis TaxID=571913 RepID=A0A0K1JL50_9MICO|nr:hypothetical protein [Luteipulveratus mongoliensis]AKU17441.1 hypothetical protein VV02_18970 [Luteipulveratus mongoliensis]